MIEDDSGGFKMAGWSEVIGDCWCRGASSARTKIAGMPLMLAESPVPELSAVVNLGLFGEPLCYQAPRRAELSNAAAQQLSSLRSPLKA